jgi:hypothetical protein
LGGNSTRSLAAIIRPALGNNRLLRDPSLQLTNVQYTATNPMNWFEVNTGTTPGGIRVKGRELISSTVAVSALTGAFAFLQVSGAAPIAILPALFPRLSAYSTIYEWYIFHQADIIFQANQPTTATGAVMIALDYDVKDNAPSTATGLMRFVTSTMANIYSDASCTMLGSLSRLPRYATSQTASPDIAQIQQAELYVAVEGVTAASGTALGYIIIQYDVEFFSPQ